MLPFPMFAVIHLTISTNVSTSCFLVVLFCFVFPGVALIRTFNVELKILKLHPFSELYVYRHVYTRNVVTNPEVQQRTKARAESKFCEKLNFHRFYFSCGFTAFMAFCNIYNLYWLILGGSTPQTPPCFLSLYSLKFSPALPK